MNIKVFFSRLIVVLCLFSCRQNTENTVFPDPGLTVEELSDGTFFKDVLCIAHDSRHVYASDTYNGRILKFDLEMNYLKSIGSHGQGPGEFSCLGGIAGLNDTLYILDCGTGGLKVFTAEGDFVRSEQKEALHIEPFLFCVDESKCIYLSSLQDPFPLVKYDTDMNRLFGFGIRAGGDEERISDMYMLQLFGDNILSVKEDEPLVTLYSRQGEQLLNRRIVSLIFDSRLLFKRQEQEKDPANRKKNYRLFTGMTTSENEVYLLYIHHNSENRPYCNRIARLAFKNSDFRIACVYQLPDVWYLSICLVGNRLVCYSGTKQEFQIYEL
jgi:hypothetical protein